MKKVEYNDIVFLEKMNEIKTTIRNSGFRLDCYKAYLVDQQMKDIVEQLYNPLYQESETVETFKKLEINVDRKSNILTYYYFALYQDNLDLLSSLLSNEISVFNGSMRNCFELLDRNFTKYFARDEYLFLVGHCRNELKSFYQRAFAKVPVNDVEKRKKLLWELKDIYNKLFVNGEELSASEKRRYESRIEDISNDLQSLHTNRYNDEERDKMCRDFVSIMRQNPFICNSFSGDEVDHFSSLLVPNVIKLFGVDGLLSMNETQKRLVSQYSSYPIVLERLKGLFEKYPDYSTPVRLNNELLGVFSDEELYHMPSEYIPLYEKAAEEGISRRYKLDLERNEALHMYPHFIDKTLFETFDDDEITGLSEKAIGKISRLAVNTRKFDEEERMKLVKASMRIMKRDRFIQKVKKILI